jgi:hypothetical protein
MMHVINFVYILCHTTESHPSRAHLNMLFIGVRCFVLGFVFEDYVGTNSTGIFSDHNDMGRQSNDGVDSDITDIVYAIRNRSSSQPSGQ